MGVGSGLALIIARFAYPDRPAVFQTVVVVGLVGIVVPVALGALLPASREPRPRSPRVTP